MAFDFSAVVIMGGNIPELGLLPPDSTTAHRRLLLCRIQASRRIVISYLVGLRTVQYCTVGRSSLHCFQIMGKRKHAADE